MISTEALLERVLEAPRPLLFLDYDGTLAEFAPSPAHIQPDPELVGLLGQLVAIPRFAAAIISGRSLASVEALVPVDGITLAGSYGIEVRLGDGERIERLRAAEIRPFIDRLLPHWRESIAHRKGFFLEDKGWSLAIHARFARKSEAARVLVEAKEAVAELGPPAGFRMMADERFLEIAPSAASKRNGVRFLLDRIEHSGAPVYLGDDDKDREGFEAVHEAGGLAAIVGFRFPAGESGADCQFPDPAAVRAWLGLLVSRA